MKLSVFFVLLSLTTFVSVASNPSPTTRNPISRNVDNVCPNPKNLTATITHDTIVTIEWDSLAPVDNKFIVRVASGEANGFTKDYAVTSYKLVLKDLPRCDSYNYTVFSQCDSINPSNNEFGSFKIGGCTNCKPFNLNYRFVRGMIVGTWSGKNNYSVYTIEYKLADSTVKDWTTYTSGYILGDNYRKQNIIRVIATCGATNDTSDIAKIKPDCNVYDLRATVINDSTVKFNWSNQDTTVKKYTLIVSNSVAIYRYAVMDTSWILTNLPNCFKYQSSIISDCDSTNTYFDHIPTRSTLGDFEFNKNCSPSCKKITSINLTPINNNSDPISPEYTTNTFINWYGGEANQYAVEYKLASDSVSNNWLKETVYTSTIVLKKLKPGENYLLRVIQTCFNKPDTSFIFRFTTYCPPVFYLSADIRGDTSVYLNWNNPTPFNKDYIVRVYSTSNNFSRTFNVSDTSILIKNLLPCDIYIATILPNCSSQNGYSVSTFFKINGCSNCTPKKLSFYGVDSTTIFGNWEDTVSGKYIVEYKLDDSTVKNWQNYTIVSAYSAVYNLRYSVKLQGLNPYATYLIRVLALCGNKYDTSVVVKVTTDCRQPQNLVVKTLTSSTVTLKWFNPSNIKAKLIVQNANGQKFYNNELTGDSITLTDLPLCNSYTAQLVSIKCGDGYQVFSNLASFDFLGCTGCRKIPYFNVSAKNSGEIYAYWTSGGNAKYTLEYKIDSDTVTTWSRSITYDTQTILRDVVYSTNYIARLIYECNVAKDTTDTYKFSFNCPNFNANATVTNDTIVTITWDTVSNPNASRYSLQISGIGFNKMYEVTGNTLVLTNLPKCNYFYARIVRLCNDGLNTFGSSQNIAFITYGCTNCPPLVTPKVTYTASSFAKMDWNELYVFKYLVEYKVDDNVVLEWSKDSTTTNSYTFTRLNASTSYIARIISRCDEKYDTSGTVKFTTECNGATSLSAAVINDSLTLLKWTEPSDAKLNYILDLLHSDRSLYKRYTVSGSHFILNNLPTCQTYIAVLSAYCNETTLTKYPVSASFKIEGCAASVCPPVQNLSYTYSNDSTIFTWKNNPTVGNFYRYDIEYKLATDAIWTPVPKIDRTETALIKGLAYCGNYVFRVRVVCNVTSASDWTTLNFKAGNRCFKIGDKNANNAQVTGIKISPNPGSTSATIEFQLAHQSNVTIKFYNAVGSEVLYMPLGNLDIGHFSHNFENLIDLPVGLYLISVQIDDDKPVTTKWVKF